METNSNKSVTTLKHMMNFGDTEMPKWETRLAPDPKTNGDNWALAHTE